MLRELLLKRTCLTEQEVSGEHPDGQTVKIFKQMVDQLRGELEHFIQANSFSKPHDEPNSHWPARLVKEGGVSQMEVKDASVQTVAMEGDALRFTHEGERPPDAIFSAEHQPENLGSMPGWQATLLSSSSRTDKVSLSIYYLFTYLYKQKT